MNWLAVSLGEGTGTLLVAGMIAWFLQMGFHEGGHAYAAYWLGDRTAFYLGKRTVNPFRHITWNDPFSVISSVVMPAVTLISLGFPMGMAWVPVNPSNFRHPLRDNAIVAFAGPLGGFVVAAIVLGIYLLLFPFLAKMGAQAATLFQLLFVMTYITAIVYSVFNLVPIPPLDGSNILYFFGNESLRNLMDRIRPFGFFIIIVVFWIFNGGVILAPAINLLSWPLLHLPGKIWGA